MRQSSLLASKKRLATFKSAPVAPPKPRISDSVRQQPTVPTEKEKRRAIAQEVCQFVVYVLFSVLASAECVIGFLNIERCGDLPNLASNVATAGGSALICFLVLAIKKLMLLRNYSMLAMLQRKNEWLVACKTDFDGNCGYKCDFPTESVSKLSPDVLRLIELECNREEVELYSAVQHSDEAPQQQQQPHHHHSCFKSLNSLMPKFIFNRVLDIYEFYAIPPTGAVVVDRLARQRFFDSRSRIVILLLGPLSCCYTLLAASLIYFKPAADIEECGDTLRTFAGVTVVMRTSAMVIIIAICFVFSVKNTFSSANKFKQHL